MSWNRENVHVSFHCRFCVTLKFCHKIAWVPLSVPCNSADFSLVPGRAWTCDLVRKISKFACANPGLVYIFQQYLHHTYMSIHV